MKEKRDCIGTCNKLKFNWHLFIIPTTKTDDDRCARRV